MPHTPEEKKRAIARLRRIRGQADALVLAVERGDPCGSLLQQLSALRGAATGLMAEVLESHLRDTLRQQAGSPAAQTTGTDADAIMRVIRPYLK
ncbi:regulator [Bosea sp. Leaf344]|uniref:metal-sensing transcriptional repressor n=1 Tax=Bosea sp. Leaf344 TaxID=1736346 RepID=UPI00070032F0|nr:metal-sensing transcriptional repressor [Bosea sp. Leaf344]KQU50140.1 regulator [Bosea sp. Leaf344]